MSDALSIEAEDRIDALKAWMRLIPALAHDEAVNGDRCCRDWAAELFDVEAEIKLVRSGVSPDDAALRAAAERARIEKSNAEAYDVF